MRKLTRTVTTLTTAAGLAVALVGAPAGGANFPSVIPLPDAWNAEGIATGPASSVYSGSLASGAVWKGSLRTGKGDVLVPPHEGRVAVGLKYSRGLLFVAGGPTGSAYVYNARTGKDVASYQLATGPSFINDVVVTRQAAYFTDSSNAVFYRLKLKAGRPVGTPKAVPLRGEWRQVEGFNANGIEASANGKYLLIVNSTSGKLYRVNPRTGWAKEVRTTASLTNGDGILLQGGRLGVVRNSLNEIAVLRLNHNFTRAWLVTTLTDPDFAVPTTIALSHGALYAVNARFGLPPGPFTIVRVDGK
jgi:outer membrane protein assembly factor BamB